LSYAPSSSSSQSRLLTRYLEYVRNVGREGTRNSIRVHRLDLVQVLPLHLLDLLGLVCLFLERYGYEIPMVGSQVKSSAAGSRFTYEALRFCSAIASMRAVQKVV
jgi:hypothetical protein